MRGGRFTAIGLAVLTAGLAAPAGAIASRSLEANFAKRSYGPGQRAGLVVAAPPGALLRLQVLRSGPERARARQEGLMSGVPVTDVRAVRPGLVIVTIHHWPPGLYFARISLGRQVAFAPFVLRASPLVRPRVAIVLPTNTWQAYNFRDDDGDGVPNTWYADESVSTVRLNRPFEGSGVPPHFDGYDLGFLRWLARSGESADYLADDDLEEIPTAKALLARYDLVVFSGHEEYVSERVYDLVVAYRNLGGNLAFLSANNFFARVIRIGETITRAGRWRDLGRPEAGLVGVQYLDWFGERWPNKPYVVVGGTRVPWLFEGTGLRNGDRFGSYGIEVDARTPSSPRGTQTLATVPDVFGPGQSAEMTYYTTPAGAKVFAAGTLNFGGSALVPPVPRILRNLWNRLSAP